MSTVTELQAAASDIISSELPDATTKLYHGIPVWCVGDQPTVGIKPAKAHVSVLFFRGQRIPDATGTLVGSGSFELAAVKLAAPDDLDPEALRTWLRAAKMIDDEETA
ncbi:MAG: DUF1801 domain-containing protein [Pseudolysinimonas sp.]